MRISVFLNRDLESNIALNCLLPELQKHTFNIFLSEKVGGKTSPIPQLQQLAFLEQEFVNSYLFPKLEANVHGGYLSFDQISQKYDTPITTLTEVTSPTTLAHISEFRPDLFISIRFGKIFKGEVLSIPHLGIINLHSAILPDYKGVLGTFRALLNNDREIGTTLHYITDSGIDTGKIILINRMPAEEGKSVLWHIVNLYPLSVEKLKEIISKISVNTSVNTHPQVGSGNYYSFPTSDDFQKFSTNGRQLFNLIEYAKLINQFYKVDMTWTMNLIKENIGLA